MQPVNTQLLRITIVTLLLVGCVAVLLPFVGTLLLAIVICITAWPAYLRLLRAVGERPNVASLIMSLILIVLFLIPMVILSASLASEVESAIAALKPMLANGLPPKAPKWISGLPFVGPEIAAYWAKVAASKTEFNHLLQELFEPTRKFLMAAATLLGRGLLQVALVTFFVFFIFRDGRAFANALLTAARKLGGAFGERLLHVAHHTVTGVMVGIVGTAAAQALVAMVGYLIAGVPGVVVLTFATFIFSLVPVIGPTLIWGGAAAWLYISEQAGWAVFMVLWGMFVISSVDSFVKPVLISRTAALPLALIIIGVFGGLAVFGFIGLFLGPALLALGHGMVREWIADEEPALTSLPHP